ncbi:MAG: nucleotidyl transferase AbiEii/AbiGii toxin family protein [Polyangiaceae bacterium]
MSFVHDDPEFDGLLQIVAKSRGLGVALVEKDYWVTHTLWALHAQGFDIWFKGGTSLSKGFNLIERFSEDLDLKLDPGTVAALRSVTNWKSDGTKATAERKAHFETLATLLSVAGATVNLGTTVDSSFRSANIQVNYPSKHRAALASVLRPFVLLEIGSARVTPFIARDMTSFVHEHLEDSGLIGEFDDNRPRSVRCVHPLVTLLEKLDALMRRHPREDTAPATFVRHFEDAARIVRARDALPPLSDYPTVRALVDEMLVQRQLATLPSSKHPAFAPKDDARWRSVQKAHDAIGPMFWGPRLQLADACADIRGWLDTEVGL